MRLSYLKLFVLLFLSSMSVSATVTNFPGGFTFGSLGTGNGEFSNMVDVAVDSIGNIYVLESTRIQKFTSNGTFIAVFGSQLISQPKKILIDSKDDIFVFDANIRKFSSNGTLILSLSVGLLDSALDHQDQIFVANHDRVYKYSNDGIQITNWTYIRHEQQEIKVTIHIDNQGNVFLANIFNSTIQKYSNDGNLIVSFGGKGTNDGEFGLYTSLNSYQDGNLYVADIQNSRIQKFSSNGTFILKWGSLGNAEGRLTNPSAIIVDQEGNILVSDDNFRISKFNNNGTFLNNYGELGNQVGQFGATFSLAKFKYRNESLFGPDSSNNRVYVLLYSDPCPLSFGRNLAGSCEVCNAGSVPKRLVGTYCDICPRGYYCINGEQFRCPSGTECYEKGLSKPNPCGKACVKQIKLIDIENTQIQKIAVDSNKNIFVSSSKRPFRIYKYAFDGQFLLDWGSAENGDFAFSPHIAIDSDDNIYTSYLGNTIQKFTNNGSFLLSLGKIDHMYRAVYVSSDNTVLTVNEIANVDSTEFCEFSKDGIEYSEFRVSSLNEGFNVVNIAIELFRYSDSSIVLLSDRIYKFSFTDGSIKIITTEKLESFMNPGGIASNFDQNIIVADNENHAILEFSKDNNLIASLSMLEYGKLTTTSIAVDKDGDIYISDSQFNRVIKIERFQCPSRFGVSPQGQCILCANGTYSSETAFNTRCLECPVGSFCANGVATSCPQNHACAFEGLEKPVLCPYGSFTSVIGNTNVKCDSCPDTERCGQCSVFPGEPLCAEYETSERARLASIVAPSVILPITFSIFFILFGLPYLLKKRVPKSFDSKRYVAFLSHYKTEAGAEARILKDRLQTCLNKRYRGKSLCGVLEVFLDSDDLYDLATLKENVKNSQVLLILLTKSIYTRPWCLVEINTALEHNIPIVPVLLQGKEYNFDQAREFLEHFSASLLEKMNPGSVAVIQKEGISIRTIGTKMGDIIPKLIARSFNANGGQRNIEAEVNDILDAIMVAANGIMTYPAHERTVSIAIPDTSATIAPEIISDKLLMSLEQELSLFFKSKGIEKSPTQVKDLALRARRDSNGVYVGMHELNMALTNRFGSGINVQKVMQNRGKYDDL